MGAGRAVKAQQSKNDGKQSRRVARQSTSRSTSAKSSVVSKTAPAKAVTKAAKPKATARATADRMPVDAEPIESTDQVSTTPKAQPKAIVATEASITMAGMAANDSKTPTGEKNEPVNVITWDDPKLDRKIIEGMLTDRNGLLDELATQGITSAAVMRRAADLGLSEAYLRHVQTVAADLAGDRPGARRVPSSLAARDCLSCNRVFLSSGPGNRICPRCRGADAGLASL